MPKSNDDDLLKNEALLSIYADHMGLTPQFIQEHKTKLREIENKIYSSLRNTNNDDPQIRFNTMRVLQDITQRTYVADTYESDINVGSVNPGSASTRDGMRIIYGDNYNKEDAEIYGFYSSVFSNYRNLVSEYRNIARLITAVNRCADMKARDILAINEHTKRAITNIYVPDTRDADSKTPANLKIDPINQEIEEKILDKYEVEDKLPRYLSTALIEGAKPVVIFPYKDIIDMASYNIELYGKKYQDFNMRLQKVANSAESFNDLISEYQHKSHRLTPDLKAIGSNWKVYGMEDEKPENLNDTLASFKKTRDETIRKYVSQEDLNEYMQRGLEDFNDDLNREENRQLMEIYGSNVINNTEKIKETKQKFSDLHAKVKIDGDLSEHFKNQIYNAIDKIDSNIEFYDQTEAPMALSINNIRRLMQFTGGYHEDPKAGVVAYGASLQPEYKLKMKDPYYDRDNLDKFRARQKGEMPRSVLDEFPEEFEEASHDLMNNCLIKEYDAEDVIPVIVSGRHVGYYLIEVGTYSGNYESINKRNCNFTDMFINLGVTNDLGISPSPSVSGSFSAGVQNIPIGGTGPASELSTIGITGAGSTALAGGMDIAGFDIGPAGEDAIHRNNIMKKIMFNVLKHKIKQNDQDDDETFTDAIMALIREGAIVQNKVKIIYIPEKYMCYFTPGLDGNGIPQSFMKNCLFTCYERVLVDMNNMMTRLTRTGTRDKITVNIGKAKNMGYSIRAIENALTTRKLNVESPFTSLDRVLKAASLSETIIVPAFDGEQLFTYEDLTQTNNVETRDDLVQKLDNEIVTSLKCPITITNPYQEEDFASLAASRNAEYRYDIIKEQKIFAKTIEKFIKLLLVGSGLYETLKKGNRNFSLKNISVVLSVPENLNMRNANDAFGTTETYINNILNIVINPDEDTETVKKQRYLFKQRLYQKLMPSLSIDEYIHEAQDLLPEAQSAALIDRMDRSVNDQIVNTEFKPLMATPDGKVVEAETEGTGSADDAGGW